MNLVRRLLLRLRALFGRRALERDMQAEMRDHLDRATERLIARGMSPDEARLAARREFGNVAVLQEEARDARGMRWIDDLRGDLHFAFRYFGRNKLTVAIIVGVFALGIGANTALITVMQGEVQRPAPVVPDDDELVLLRIQQRATRIAAWRTRGFSHAELHELATHRATFTHVAGWLEGEAVLNPGDSIGPRGVRVQFVTPNYFAALGVPLIAGPGFRQDVSSLRTGGESDLAAVMSFARAERLYGTPTSAVGRRVLVNDVPVRVVGLAPRGFQGALRNMNAGQTSLWIPVSARADLARVPASWLVDDASMTVFARLAPGASHEAAAAAAQLVAARSLPDSATRVGMSRTAQAFSLHALLPENEDRLLIFGLLGILGLLLLLVTCTNVSSLMVAAAVARRHEIAVRLSLGASRARILRQLLTESTVLAVTGGAAGLTFCWWLLRWEFGRSGSVDGTALMPDVYTLAWTMAIAIGTGILFGLSPALHATRSGAANALRDSGTGASRRSRLQRGFVIAQIVFSLPLLVMLGTTLSLVVGDYRPLRPELSERVLRITFNPLQHTGPPGQRREAVDSLIPRLTAHPDIIAVVPEASFFHVRRFRTSAPVGAVTRDGADRTLRVVGAAPGWFSLLGIPILLGRDVALADTAEHHWPVVIGSDLARSLWHDASPIGRTLPSAGERDSISLTVVGVYDATHPRTAGRDSISVFTAHGGMWRRDMLLVRTRNDAKSLMPVLRPMIRDLAPGLPVTGMWTLADADDDDRADAVELGALVGAGGMLALLLASLGLYGVIALAVRQRTREIGIRIALGANPRRVARMFLASGVRLGAIALVIGLPPSIIALRYFLSRFEGLAPMPRVGPWAIGTGVAAVLLLVVVGASWLPARRAAAVDPASTLRVE